MTMKTLLVLTAAMAVMVLVLAGGRIVANSLVVSGALTSAGGGFFLILLGSYLAGSALGFIVIRAAAGTDGAKPSLVLSAIILAVAAKSMTIMVHPGWFPAALLASLWLSWWLVFNQPEPASSMLRRQGGRRSAPASSLRRAAGEVT